jgi:DNA polymerase zeta
MLKRASKEYKKNVKNLSPAVLRQLEARQLALKYVANVTYGYTSATFSGRCAMPLLADTIVECGRKTLRKAINMANCWGREGKWKGAKVIYGDTDSLFVRLPGRSYKEAFDFGEELCKAVTADNPPPVQLKLEKVYLGSIMQTMKRYCGMKFESRNDRKPSFEAKGLETVRRDQCALTQKVLRNALITLFRHGIDAVHDFLNRQWYLINAGHIPMSDFVLTGRVRSQYRGGREGPVQAVLAQRLAEADPGHITRNKERIPYVIVATPGKKFKLKDCVLTPVEMLERWDGYTIHSAYYIERVSNTATKRDHWAPLSSKICRLWLLSARQSCTRTMLKSSS